MTAKPERGGTVVTLDVKITKFPIIMLPIRLIMPLVGPKFEKKMLGNMKVDLEGAS